MVASCGRPGKVRWHLCAAWCSVGELESHRVFTQHRLERMVLPRAAIRDPRYLAESDIVLGRRNCFRKHFKCPHALAVTPCGSLSLCHGGLLVFRAGSGTAVVGQIVGGCSWDAPRLAAVAWGQIRCSVLWSAFEGSLRWRTGSLGSQVWCAAFDGWSRCPRVVPLSGECLSDQPSDWVQSSHLDRVHSEQFLTNHRECLLEDSRERDGAHDTFERVWKARWCWWKSMTAVVSGTVAPYCARWKSQQHREEYFLDGRVSAKLVCS